MKKRELVFLSERGWQGARSCVLEAAKLGHPCRVFIKGRPSKEIRTFISQYPNIRNIFVPRQLFVYIYFIYLFTKRVSNRVGVVFVERPKTFRVVNRFPLGLKNYWLAERMESPFYKITDECQKQHSLPDVLETL